MGTHLYLCDKGEPMVIALEGMPPPWVTCPACDGIECNRCDGAELQGEAPAFSEGAQALYRCKAGHQKALRAPAGQGLPESAQCTECDGMLLAVVSS